MADLMSVLLSEASLLQDSHNLEHRAFLNSVHMKDILHYGSFYGINDIVSILIKIISEGRLPSDALSVDHVLLDSSLYLYAQFLRIVLVHAKRYGIHQGGNRAFQIRFRHRQDSHSVVHQLSLIVDGICHVSSKAGALPNNDISKALRLRVTDHTLEVGSIIAHAGLGSVNIFSQDLNSLGLGIGFAFSSLSFDGVLRLVLAGIAKIKDSLVLGCVLME